eukprot:1153694-Pelagomonas_calceolata.AAC.2
MDGWRAYWGHIAAIFKSPCKPVTLKASILPVTSKLILRSLHNTPATVLADDAIAYAKRPRPSFDVGYEPPGEPPGKSTAKEIMKAHELDPGSECKPGKVS